MKKFTLLLLSIFATLGVMAQVTTSNLNGTVTEENGSPLMGATVIAVHNPSGTEYGVVTDANGRYTLNGLRAGGPYTITMSFVGYQSVEFTDVNLPLGETVTRSGWLKESMTIDDVIVVAEGSNSSMNVHRSGSSTNISKQTMTLTPAVNRSMNDLLRLAPQSSTTSNGFAVGGGNYRQSYVTVDGAAFNNAFGIGQNLPANGSPISLDALDQITIAVTPYDVRQSGFTGGSINAVTKSGDNEFRGSVYTFLKSNSLRGDKAGSQVINNIEDAHSYTYGLTLGGPIVKNKLFFFINGEYDDNVSAGPNGVPSKDGSEYGKNNVKRPTAADMDKMSKFLQDTYGYNPGRYMGYSLKTPGYKLMARLDWNISQNHKMNVRFSRTHTKDSSGPSTSVSPLTASTIYPGGNGISAGQNINSNYAMYFESQRYYTLRDFTTVAAELNSRFCDGRLNNTLRYTFSDQDQPRSNEGGAFPTVHILKDGAPYMAFGPDVFTAGNISAVQTHVITDEITYNVGKNNLIAGVQFENNHALNGYMQAGAGFYVYDSMEAFMAGGAPSAFGITHGNNANLDQFYSEMTYRQFSLYLQDELNLHRNFKLTAGLRFEVPMYPSLKDNYNEAFAKLKWGEDGKSYSTDQVPGARLTVSPRVGFNWDMTGERKYVLRGGSGYFVGRLPFVWLVSAVGNSNVGQITTFYNNAAQAAQRGVNMPNFHTNVNDILKDLYPNGFNPESPVAPSSPTILDANLKMPSSWKSSLALDIELPGEIDFSVEGIYSRDYNPAVFSNLNYKPAGDPSEIVKGSGDYRGKTQGKYNSTDLFYITNGKPGAYSYSVTAQLHKHFDFGLDVQFSYTHAAARSYGDGIGDQVTSAYKTNTYSREMVNNHELGYGTYVAPDRILLSLNYRKEYAKHFATSVGLLYEGSQLGFVGSSYSYTRFTYTFDSCVTGDGGANSLLYIPESREALDKWNFKDTTIGGEAYTAKDQKDDFWAYIQQDSYLKKNLGKYAERGGAIMPWHHQVDLHFGQEFFIATKGGKRNTLEFGMDIQNLPNLLSKEWGTYQTIRNTSLIKVNSDGSCQYNGYSNQRNTVTSETLASLSSTWRIMFSLRYRFN